MRVVVSNTGPLLHLWEAEALELIALAGEVHIPKAVDLEMAQHNTEWAHRRPAWVLVDILTPPYDAEAFGWQQAGILDPGEAEAIALARQIKANWLLTDDVAARLLAQSLGFEVHGSLGIVLWAAATGRLTRAEAEIILDRLKSSSLWISARVFDEAKAMLDQLLPRT